ncbi:hypothetical protein HK101_010545 [Irineochytrium annulatum]|nr:hypothetical protein HK101_010545 [Irineochytrium annulatum]
MDLPPELVEILQADKKTYLKELQGLVPKIKEARTQIQALQKRVDDKDLETSKGVSLLEIKSHTLLSYLSHLSVYLMLKLTGTSLEDHPAVDRMIEHRVILERIRPMETKLKYQIDKLVRAAATANYETLGKADGEDSKAAATSLQDAAVADPLRFKPNPGNFAGGDDVDGVYRPPRLVPVPYEEKRRRAKGELSDRSKKSLAKSRIMTDLMEQHGARPEVVTSHGTGHRLAERKTRVEEELDQIREKEEETFTRFTTSKALRRAEERRVKNGGTLNFVDEIEDLEKDFFAVKSMDRVVGESEVQRFGNGVLGKRNRLAASLFSKSGADEEEDAGGKRKRKGNKFSDASELLDAKSREPRAKNSAFDKDMKRVLKPRHKKSKAGSDK